MTRPVPNQRRATPSSKTIRRQQPIMSRAICPISSGMLNPNRESVRQDTAAIPVDMPAESRKLWQRTTAAIVEHCSELPDRWLELPGIGPKSSGRSSELPSRRQAAMGLQCYLQQTAVSSGSIEPELRQCPVGRPSKSKRCPAMEQGEYENA